MVVIAHVPYTFEHSDETRKEIYLIKVQLGNFEKHREEASTTPQEKFSVHLHDRIKYSVLKAG